MINYNLELNKLLNKIYNKKICDILLKEDLNILKKLTLDKAKKLMNSTEVYLGNDLKDYLLTIIPEGSDGYFLKVAISKTHNITYPILYNENKEPIKSYSYNHFSTVLWDDHTNDLLVNDIYNLFSNVNFNQYVSDNLDSIYEKLINYVIELKKDSTIIININNKNGLVNTVKDMILNGSLDLSYAIIVVDLDKLREHMENSYILMDYYDEFDKLEDDLEECLNDFFKYNDDELLDVLMKKEGFKIVDNIGLVK